MRVLAVIIVLVLLVFALPQSFFTVDRTEFVYLTTFGRHLATFDGANDAEAGLHLKWPWPVQSVQRLDRRLQYFDLPAAELLTHDPRGKTIDKTLTIDGYVCWRIADKDGVDRFIRTVGTPDRARAVLGQRISSELGAAIGRMELDDLISTEEGRVDRQRERLRQQLLADSRLGKDYGIAIVDIRIRRTSHPPQVRQAIFDRIISERGKKVADYQSEGEKLAADIRSAADRRVKEILAEANALDRRLRGEADAEADRIRNQAHSKDVQFYAFLKKLEEYQRILGDNRSMLLLSSHRELFDLLFQPPRPESGPAKPSAPEPSPGREPSKTGGN
ncbi:MAG TPA: protease modulator HflC [Gemmataceae bacterium]|nr:protease modulator HflC [Gemmataceae bacterium]